MPEPLRLLDNVRERDLDLILMSCLFVSESFRDFMLQRAIGWSGRHDLVSVRVSESGDAGETDILLVVDLGGGGRRALMIEDKIGAMFQPAQADRYRQRGAQGVRDGRWSSFATCLCAPRGYLVGPEPSGDWDACVALESIAEWAERSGDRLHAFLGAICLEVVNKRNARLLEKSADATAFWQAYRQFANAQMPDVGITRLADANSTASPWPRFGASVLPDGVLLEHKPQQGRVDLTFNKLSLDVLKQRVPATLPFDIMPVKTGGSAALRIDVPRIDHLRPFNEQQEGVLLALAAVERLLSLGQQITPTMAD